MSWGVVAMISEPDPVVLAWVAHYCRLGADHVWLYLDGPHQQVETLLSGRTDCTVVRVDGSHWPFGAPYPQGVGARQRRVLADAYDGDRVEWLLHADADEFLIAPPDTSVSAWLAGLAPEVDFVFANVAERRHVGTPAADTVFDGVFRRATPRRLGRKLSTKLAKIDGDMAQYLDNGLCAYSNGKSFFRTGRNLRLKVHMPEDHRALTREDMPGAPLLHFDGLTRAGWCGKKLRVVAVQPNAPQGRHEFRAAQFRTALELQHDPEGLSAFYDRLKCLSPAQLAGLQEMDLIQPAELDLEGAVAAAFDGLVLDFSPDHIDGYMQAFDATPPTEPWPTWIKRRVGAALRRLGLR